MRRVILFWAAMTILGAQGPRAVTPPSDSAEVVELPDTVFVTANRFGIDRANCVWPTAVVRPAGLQQAATLSGALAGGTGVDVRDYTGAGSVATLSNWGSFNRHMLLLYDGRVVRDYSLGGFNLSEYSPAEFDQVELLKGPQSAFYGSDALGGVVNLVPRTMLFDRATFSTQLGSFDFRRHRLEASHKVGRFGIGGWGELMSANNNRPNSGADQQSFGVRSDILTADGRGHFHATLRVFRDSLGSPGPVPPPGNGPSLGNGEASSLFDHQRDRNVSLDAHFSWRPAPETDVRFDAFSDRKKLTFVSRYEEYWNTPIDTAQTNTVYRKRSSGLTGRIQRNMAHVNFSGGVDWLYGALEYRNEQDGPFAGLPDYWRGAQHETDLWSAVTGYFGGRVRPNLSGRLSFVKGREVQPSYNVGIVYDLASDWKIKTGYGFAYRIPSIADQFARDTYTRGNPDLNTEKSHTVIATLAYAAGSKRVQAHLTGFSQRVSELIQYQFDPDIYQYVPRNINLFRSNGFDAGLRAKVGANLTLELATVFQHATQTIDGSGQYVDAYYVPNLTWSMSADYQASRRLSVGATLRFVSERWMQMYGGDGKTIDRVYELGARANFVISRHLSVSVSGEDLTDQQRPSTFGFAIDDRDYPSPGRRIYVSLTATTGD
jgi:vitamin B12 transporter